MCKLKPANLSHFSYVYPTESIGKQLPMFGTDYKLQIFFCQKSFLLSIQPPKQWHCIKARHLRKWFSKFLDSLTGVNQFSYKLGEALPSGDREGILLVVGHLLDYITR